MSLEFIGRAAKKPHRFYAATGPLFEGDGMTPEAAAELLDLLHAACGMIGVNVSAVAVVECDIDGQMLEPDTPVSDETLARLMGQIVEGSDDTPAKQH